MRLFNLLHQPLIQTLDLPCREKEFYEENPEHGQRCLLDLTIPEEQSGFATVVWFHGGGLTGGIEHTPMELTLDPVHPNAVAACG